jgi:hypothetical protein
MPTTMHEIAAYDSKLQERMVEPAPFQVAYVGLLGFVMFLVCTAGAIGKLGIAELRGPSTVGCEGWIIIE